MKPISESETLAERLHSLYQTYGCENELPSHDGLVAKIDSVKQEVRDATKMELDRDCVYPLLYNEALQLVEKTFLGQKLSFCLALASVEGEEYAVRTFHEKQKEPNNFLFKLYALYGGIKSFSSSVKEVFLNTCREEEAKELMEEHNKHAAQYFKGFKNNIAYYFLKP